MDSITLNQGESLIIEDEAVDRLYIVYSGGVTQSWLDNQIMLGPGMVVGISDALNSEYASTYTVAIDGTVLFPCDYQDLSDLDSIFIEQPVFIFGFAKAAFRQCRQVLAVYQKDLRRVDDYYNICHEIYREYKKICRQFGMNKKEVDGFDEFERIVLDEPILDWEIDYIDSLNSVDNKEIEIIYGKRIEIVKGIIGICCQYMHRAMVGVEIMGYYMEEFAPVLASSDSVDLFDVLYDLRIFVAERGINPERVDNLVEKLYKYAVTSGYYEQQLLENKYSRYKNHDFHQDMQAYELAVENHNQQFDDSFAFICEYIGMSQSEIESNRQILLAYLGLEKRDGRDEKEHLARKKMSELFYRLYEAVFFESVNDTDIPMVIQMFLHFGFMCMEAVGEEIADQLTYTIEKMFLCENDHVFTIYTWLLAIYNGLKEPSKNEFELDYAAYLKEELKTGNITEEAFKRLSSDKEEKVRFEIANFFTTTNRITSGKVVTFCPVLTEEEFVVEPDRMLVTISKLRAALEKIEDVDFQIFFRERYFSDVEAKIKIETFQVRIEPDIILLPNCGTRAFAWQECSGVKADTPARFVFPIFSIENLDKLMLYCCGSFRWEICRKEQGIRWNDVGTDSLTADFYDYFTFYRKNKELTADNKEKIKTLLKSSRNSMREAFVKLYNIWINYESQGSIRLNKTERNIMCRYCTFSKKYRSKVASHPMFEKAIGVFEATREEKLRHIINVFDKYEKMGGVVPDDVKEGIHNLRM